MSRQSNLNYLVKIALLGAIAGVLMLFEMPLGIFPDWLKLDISDLPAVIGAVVLGPLAGIIVVGIKILLNFILNGTITGGIGELANLLIGISFVLPIGLIYKKSKSFASLAIGTITGVVAMAVMGALMNYFLLLPLYANLFGMEVIGFVDMAKALPLTGQFLDSIWDFIIIIIVPFNLVKGFVIGSITLVSYKFIIQPLERL